MPTKACARCGLPRQHATTPLCLDCRQVALDLRELEVWDPRPPRRRRRRSDPRADA